MKKFIIILGIVGTSLSAVLVRFADAPSTVLVFYRMLFSVLLLAPVVLTRCRSEYKSMEKKHLFLCMASGLFLGIHFACYFEALNRTSIAACVSLVDTEVFFVALGGSLFLKEKLSGKGWMYIVLTFAGSVIIAASDVSGGGLLGDLIAVAGAASSCIYTLIGRKLRAVMTTNAYTWVVYFFAGLVILAASAMGGHPVIPVQLHNLWIALGLAIFCTLLGHSIFSWGLKYEKASFVSAVKLLEPVFASILGFVFLREIPSLSTAMGAVLIIVGIILLSRELGVQQEKRPNCSVEANKMDEKRA